MNKEKIIYPDYNRSIINITASILQYFGCETKYPALKELSKEYLDKFDNIIFLVVDGLGAKLIEHHLADNAMFRKNNATTLTSVFPPTTAAAISSYLSGVSPWEHGIIGWTLYLKEYFKMVDFLPLSDATNGEFLPEEYSKIHEKFHFESIFKIINELRPEVEQHYVTPESLAKSKYTKMASDSAEIFSYSTFGQALDYIHQTVKENSNKKLFYCYTGEPDKSMHKLGVYKSSIKDIIESLQSQIQALHKNLSSTKSLILVTADHGMIEVEESIYANEDKALWDSLILPTFPEPRFISCFIHKDKEADFLAFAKKYSSEFILLSKAELIEKSLLGKGSPHPRVQEMLGDYVLIAKSSKAIQTIYQSKESTFKFKGMHAGLTEKEMLVPLIILD